MPAALALAASGWAGAQQANLIGIASLGTGTIENGPKNQRADMLLASDGNFYIASFAGGSSGGGAVSRITPAGVVTTIASLTGNSGIGAQSYARLIEASDGNLYGTTYVGGDHGAGTVFRVSLTGTLNTIHSFGGSKGLPILPYGGLVQAADGNLYGTTLRGGADDAGTVFRLTLSGDFTVIHEFTGDDGKNPEASLVVGPSGDLYGTTLIGGDDDRGTVFRITTTGQLTSLYSFPKLGKFNSQNLAINETGANPRAALMLAADGNFYGTAYQGGANGYGTVFRMTPAGAVTTYHDFTGPPNGAGFPLSSITQDAAGNLYGTSERGGIVNRGAAWRLAPGGAFTLLHGMVGGLSDGLSPYATLLPVGGELYTVSYNDLLSSAGAIFKLQLPAAGVLPVNLSVAPAQIETGGSATLTWSSPTATSCTRSGAWQDATDASGSQSVTPANPGYYTYILGCTDGAGVSREAYATLVVTSPPLEPVDGGGTGAISAWLLLLCAALLSFRLHRTEA